MSRHPAHLLKMRVVYDLPVHVYRGRQPKPETMQQPESRLSFLKFLRQNKASQQGNAGHAAARRITMLFNAATWLDFSAPPEKPISLWLMVEDEKGCHAELVDEQSVTGNALMLSGNVSINVRGEIKSMRLACAGFADSDRFRLSDQHVELLEESSHASRRAS